MRRAHTIAIDLVRRRLRAVQVAPARNGVRVARTLAAVAPESLDLDDPQATGEWIASELKHAKIPRGRATIVISREDVVLKRLVMPTDDVYELPGMVRLAMRRELPFDGEDAVVDFVTVATKEGETTVLAVAIPAGELENVRKTAKAAGLRPERITLRSMGTGALVRRLQEVSPRGQETGGWLAVDVTGNGVELCVVVDGAISFSRATAIAPDEDDASLVDAVVTETKRSWMSYRIVGDTDAISRAVVTGPPDVARAVAEELRDMLAVPVEVLREHPSVEPAGEDPAGTWPLVGLLLEPRLGGETIDFANPRQAPDRHARRRQAILAVVGLILLAAVGGFLFSQRELKDLERELAAVRSDINGLRDTHHRYEREFYRLAHLDRWDDFHVDWLAHLEYLRDRLPTTPDRLVLSEWSGSLRDPRVEYDGTPGPGREPWIAPREITVVVEGEAASRELADRFRAALVESKEYRVQPTGAETAGGRRLPAPSFPFNLTLRTNALDPTPADEETDDDAEGTRVATGEDDW